jgi:hypothetical protein
MTNYKDVSELEGKTLTKIEGMEKGSDEIMFYTDDGKRYLMYHDQDCCESVTVDDVCGRVEDLMGSPIIRATEDSNSDEPPGGAYEPDSFTWTFYNLATRKGHVTIRWYGESNGYYSESVDFKEVDN